MTIAPKPWRRLGPTGLTLPPESCPGGLQELDFNWKDDEPNHDGFEEASVGAGATQARSSNMDWPPTMNVIKSSLRRTIRFLKRDDGPTAVEYAFLLALILTVALTAIAIFGQTTQQSLQQSGNSLDAAVAGGV